jgi:ribosomal protein L11 methyltransferase
MDRRVNVLRILAKRSKHKKLGVQQCSSKIWIDQNTMNVSLLLFLSLLSLLPTWTCSFQLTLPLPKALCCRLFLQNYVWDLPEGSDTAAVTDMLIEMGALSAQVSPLPGDDLYLWTNEEFDQTGKLETTGWRRITFSAMQEETENLVKTVIDLLELPDSLPYREYEPDAVVVLDSALGILLPDEAFVDIKGKHIYVDSGDDDGWAFGDGNHPSTRLAILSLEQNVRAAVRVLDFGCGTGILSLASKALGALSVTAVDIAPDALALTERNWRRNFYDEKGLEVVPSSSFQQRPIYDVVVANIPANTLMSLLPILTNSLAPEGILLTSGYPTSEGGALSDEAKEQGLQEITEQRRYEAGWMLQAYTKVS